MQRVSALWQASPRKVVGALSVLMLAAMMAVASGASFTSTTPNVGNVVTAGIMQVDTDKSGGAILNINGLVPGNHPQSGTVTLTNSGDADGVLTLNKSNVSNSGPALSSKLDLVVTDLSDGSTVYSGKLGNMGARPAGTIAKGASKTYDFTVTFPDGGLPAGPTSGDNAYQSASTSVDFAWDSVSQ
jgi:spore coat-associated protein N